ncbi:MinD/ParA family ATP-binding protein [Agromyces sp. NPDC004153]
MTEVFSPPKSEVGTATRCMECGSTAVGARFCTQCGAPLEQVGSVNEPQTTTTESPRQTDLPAPAGPFAGARRATGYVEDPHTSHRSELAELRAQVTSAPDLAELESPIDNEGADAPREPVIGHVASSAVEANLDGSARTPSRLELPLEDLSITAPADSPALATRGLRGVLARVGIRVAPSATEQAALDLAALQLEHERIIRQATWTRAVGVLVANRKGGVGKTPVSLLLGGVLAAVRGGSVAIVEVSDDPGALAFRAEGNPQRGIGELVRDVGTIRTAGQLAGYTAPQTSFASVIGSAGRRPRLAGEDVTRVANVVDHYHAIRIMDSGNQPSSSAFQGAIQTADALVIPVLNAGDAVLEAVALLDELHTDGGKAADLASNAIIVRLTDGRPEHPQVVDRINQIIDTTEVRAVFDVPYDSHIAERGQLTLDRLDPSTRRAFTAIAANVVSHLQHSIR